MRRYYPYLRYLFLALLAAGALSACGGGGVSIAPEEPTVEQRVVATFSNLPHELTSVDTDGNTVTVELTADDFQIITTALSDLTTAQTIFEFLVVLQNPTVDDINGNKVTLAGTRFTVTVTQTVSLTVLDIIDTLTLNVITLTNATITTDITLTNATVTTDITLTNATITTDITLTNATITTDITLTNATVTTDITLTNITLTSTLTMTNTSFIDVTATSQLADTLTVNAGFSPPNSTITVSIVGLTMTTIVATITNVQITGIVTVGTKSTSQLMFLNASGEWESLIDEMLAQLIALGITLPAVTVDLDGTSVILITGSLTSLLTLATTINATLDVVQTLFQTLTTKMTTDATLDVMQTLFQTLTTKITTSATLDIMQTVTVNVITSTILLSTTTVQITVSTVTLHAAYVSLTLINETTVSYITLRVGATVGYDSVGKLSYIVLPPPSSTSTVNYKTAEFNRNYGLNQIGADHAYQRGYFGQGVTVGIVDTGMLTTHTDLTANLVPGRRADSAGNLHTDIFDAAGHGTGVGGVVGAVMNGSGVHGVAPSVSLMPLQFGDSDGILSGDELRLFEYAADAGVQILNNSWGSYDELVAGEYIVNNVTNTIIFNIPIIAPLLSVGGSRYGYLNGSSGAYADYTSTFADKDMAIVWAAGNSYWHSGGAIEYCNMNNIDLEYYQCGNNTSGTYTPEELIANFTALQLTLVDGSDTYNSYAFGQFSYLGVEANAFGDYALAPLYQPSLLGKWVAVVAVDSSSKIASFSNGCGSAGKYWCLAAPGVRISTTYNTSISAITRNNGTSFSAPHVAGALAVLKSRLTYMPMEVVLALLFTTATDLGDAGLDDVYGHGLVNLEKAVTLQGAVRLVTPGSQTSGADSLAVNGNRSNNLLFKSGLHLSPVLQGLGRQLAGISVAVEYLDGFYYNMPLDVLIDEGDSNLPNLGNAASDMIHGSATTAMGYGFSVLRDIDSGVLLRATHENEIWHLGYDFCSDCVPSVWEVYESEEIAKPFFAAEQHQGASFVGKLGEGWEAFAATGWDDDAEEIKYEQYGLRWRHADKNWRLLSEFSRTDEEGTLLGGKYDGAFAVAGAETYQGRLHAGTDLSEGWRGFADYRFGWTNGETKKNSIINRISSLRFDGWRLGVVGRSLFGVQFDGDGVMRFGVTRQPSIRSGNVHLRYGIAGEESVFIEDYQYELLNGYDTVNHELSLTGDTVTTYQWGYLFTPQDGMQAAIGLEYTDSERNKNTAAASLAFHWSF